MENDDKIFEFKNKKYNLRIKIDEENELTVLSMLNIDTQREIQINFTSLPPKEVKPDYILLKFAIGEKLINELIKCKLISERTGYYVKVNLDNLYKYDHKGVKEFLDYHTHKIKYEEMIKEEQNKSREKTKIEKNKGVVK